MSAVEALWQTLAAVGAVMLAVSIVWFVFELVAAVPSLWRNDDDRSIAAAEARRVLLRDNEAGR